MNGIILDEPYSSALLRMGLSAGLIDHDFGTSPLKKMPLELAKGLSPHVREMTLINILLYENIVVPGDKAFTSYFDWSKLQQYLPLRIPSVVGPKERIREESLRIWLRNLPKMNPATLSGWDRVLVAYLRKRMRGLGIDAVFVQEALVETDHSDFWPVLERGTQEEKVLFMPELIDFRLRLFLKDRFGFRSPRSKAEREVYQAWRKLYWLFETFFHLRYLKNLALDPQSPRAVATTLGRIEPAHGLRCQPKAEYVYSIFLDEIKTLPRPRNLDECLNLLANPSSLIREFRTHFHEWHQAISRGGFGAEAKLRSELRKISGEFRRLRRWKAVNGITNYVGLPATILGAAAAEPITMIGGLIVSLIGFGTQAWADSTERRSRWLLLSTD